MSVTYTDQVRPAAARPAARIDGEAYVPVYARSGARKSNKPVKTWMILAPLGVLAVGGAAAAMLMQPAAPAEEAAPFAPLAAQLAASETAPLPLPSMPMETPAELTTAAPIPPSAAAPVERRAAPAAPARAAARAAAAPEAVEAPVVPTGPQPYLSVAPQTVAPQPTAPMIEAPAAPVSSSAAPAPIVIAPTT
jgi:hypothetical protein